MADNDQRSTAEVLSANNAEHAQKLDIHTRHLCVNNWMDVVKIAGALAGGAAFAYGSQRVLVGRWRMTPVVVGLVLSIAARQTDPARWRFTTKAAMAVGGFALLASTFHYTMVERIEADRTLEA